MLCQRFTAVHRNIKIIMNNLAEIEKSIIAAMQEKKLDPLIIEEFKRRVKLVYNGATGKVSKEDIDSLDPNNCIDLDSMTGHAKNEDWQKLVQIKLNGGLGTSMGLTQAKTLIQVKDGLNFLEIILHQTRLLRKQKSCELPMLFMNSFNTQKDSLAVGGIQDINAELSTPMPPDFLQNMVPRIDAKSLKPLTPLDDPAHWCPPGHGDIFLALKITGTLNKLIDAGYKVAFISNGDNLGATPDDRILKLFLKENLDWASEVTPKTRADLKGGVLFQNRRSQRTELLEIAQVEDDFVKEFQDVSHFPYFNINNLWVNLEALKSKLDSDNLPLSLIVNPKQFNGLPILQLETAMGAAIGNFENSRVIIVPRSRFAPVKSCADLLVRKSDIYILDPNTGNLLVNPERKASEPTIKLDDNYKKIQDFQSLFMQIPSLINITHLEIEGKILFDMPVTLCGEIKLVNTSESALSISEYLSDATSHTIKDKTISR